MLRRPSLSLLLSLPLALLMLASLAACDQLGIETAVQTATRLEAEGKAAGGACRQAGRALEDCYQINPKMTKAAIFAGWRDMDAYMRENKLETIKPEFPVVPPAFAKPKKAAGGDQDDADDKTQKAPDADKKPAAKGTPATQEKESANGKAKTS